MSDRDPAPPAPDDAPARLGAGGLPGIPGLVVLATRSRAQARDAALVLRAAGVPHELVGGGHGWQLVVPAGHGARAQEELADYAEENAAWPPPRPPFVPLSSGRAGALPGMRPAAVLDAAGQPPRTLRPGTLAP